MTARIRRLLIAPLVVLLLFGGLTACSRSVHVREPESCKNYWLSTAEARFGVQQEAKGKPITWGLYTVAKFKSAHFYVRVYADGTAIETKNQNYEPHGSINADRAKKYSGKYLRFVGQVTKGNDFVTFDVQCKIL